MGNVILPKIELNVGINSITINTTISPSSFKLKYNKAEAGAIEETITTDGYFENKPNDEVKPISAITLRSSEVKAAGQTIYDDDLIEQYGVNELIIEEDYFAYTDSLRIAYLEAAKALFGLTYKPLTIDVLGSVYLDFNDIIKVINPQGEEYKTFSLNNNHEYNGVLYNTISVPALTETEEKYKYETEDKTFRRKTAIEIDKANQQIQSIVSEIGDRSQKTTTVTQDIDGLEILVENIEDLTDEVTGTNALILNSCLEGSILYFRIIGNNTVFSKLTPAVDLVPSNSLYPYGSSYIFVEHYDENDILISTDRYDLGIDEPLRQYSATVYDEFRYDFEDEENKAKVIRRVGITENGTLYPLTNEIIEPVDIPDILLSRGKNVIDLDKPYVANCYAKYVLLNAFTDKFATTYELRSSIDVLRDEINIEVAEKVGKDEVIARINTAVRDHQGIITIEGNQVIINSDYFDLTADGQITARRGIIGDLILQKQSNGSFLYKNFEVSGNRYQSGLYIPNDTTSLGTWFLYAGHNRDTGETGAKINHDGTIFAEKVHFNGESGYFRIDYDSGRIATQYDIHGFTARLDDGNNDMFMSLTNGSNGTWLQLYDSPLFGVYDSVHSMSLLTIIRYRPEVGTNEAQIRLDVKSYYKNYEVATVNDISDENVKKNIKATDKKALDVIDKINFVEFDWDKKKIDKDGHINIGIVAQDLQKLDESYVQKVDHLEDGKKEELLAINVLNLLSTTTKAVQELNQKVKDLEEEIKKLKGEK